jgi:hypothetical protein
MTDVVRVQVLMQPQDARRFTQYCEREGHKKSTLIARLVREHLDREERRRVDQPAGRGARR